MLYATLHAVATPPWVGLTPALAVHERTLSAMIQQSGVCPTILGSGATLNLHAEFSFGLEFSTTGKALVLNTLENAMINLNTYLNCIFDTLRQPVICAIGKLTALVSGIRLCRGVELSIWCGVLLLRSQVGNTPARIEKHQVDRMWLFQEKPGRFESFPPHHTFCTANNSFKPTPHRGVGHVPALR